MDSLTQADIEYLGDILAVSVLIVCFCLGWVAGGIR